jgi:hypothetical protein
VCVSPWQVEHSASDDIGETDAPLSEFMQRVERDTAALKGAFVAASPPLAAFHLADSAPYSGRHCALQYSTCVMHISRLMNAAAAAAAATPAATHTADAATPTPPS